MSNKKEFEAVIAISAVRKMGFVKDPDTEEDIVITEDNLRHALFGDTVRIRVTGEMFKDRDAEKPLGEVVEIINRATTRFVGVIERKDSGCFLIPDNSRIHVDIHLDETECSKAKDNDKVFVELGDWPLDETNPSGKVIEVLGQKGEHEVEMRAILLDKGIVSDFSKEVRDEAEKLNSEFPQMLKDELPLRRDMRDITTFTIDPVDAKDFDDALSFKELPNGNYEIGIHIADVSYFVRPGTELDKEAVGRSFSVYMVDRTIPMLPETLSNDICSLNPDEERLAFSAIFEITPNAEVKSEWFGRTIIKSNYRFTYETAQEVLDKNEGPYNKELKILNDVSLILTKWKYNQGAIKFDREEFKFELDADGVPLRIVKKEALRTHKLIEEYMLLANRSVAKFIYDTCENNSNPADDNICNLMYRVHNVPDGDKIKELSSFVKALGYNLQLDKDGGVTSKGLNALLENVAGKPEEGLVTTAAIRTMSKAIYATQNSGHFGLAFEFYTTFTSPIRRYPDVIVHRILQDLLTKKKVDAKTTATFQKIAEQATKQEINAQDAERSSIRYKQVEFMTNHVGEEFNGIVSGVAPFGAFVVLNDSGAEGMIHISKIGKEYFEYNEKKYCLIGQETGKKVTLGDKVRVKIEGANLDDRKLEMSFVNLG